MRKLFKNISKFIVFTMIITTMGTTAFAQVPNNNLVNKGIYVQADTIPPKVSELAKSKFQFLLEGIRLEPQNYEINSAQIDDLYLGEGFNVFSIEKDNLQSIGTYYFPVMLNGNIKFIFTIILNSDGSCSATLGRDFAIELNSLKKNEPGDPYLILRTPTGQLFAKNSKESFSLNEKYLRPDQKKGEVPSVVSINKSNYRATKNISYKFETLPRNTNDKITSNVVSTVSTLSSTSSNGTSLGVSRVPQGDYNICWASTVACMVNYRNKTSLSAINVCNEMGVALAGQPASFSPTCLNHYNIPSTYINGVVDFSTIMQNIDNGKPIYMSSDSDIGAHATTLYGYITSSQGVGIQLYDSAYDSFKQGYSSGSTFTYDFGGHTMTWVRTTTINSTSYPGYYIQYGSTGYYVGQVQTRLNGLGFNCGSVDQDFGSMTKNAVIAFQRSRGLGQDGVVGPTTWSYLFNR